MHCADHLAGAAGHTSGAKIAPVLMPYATWRSRTKGTVLTPHDKNISDSYKLLSGKWPEAAAVHRNVAAASSSTGTEWPEAAWHRALSECADAMRSVCNNSQADQLRGGGHSRPVSKQSPRLRRLSGLGPPK